MASVCYLDTRRTRMTSPKLVVSKSPQGKPEVAGSKTKYMVGVFQEAVALFTVLAHDEQAATEAIQQGFGRPAGTEGPRTVAVMTRELALTDPEGKTVSFFGAFDAIKKQAMEAQQKEESKIVVPKIVVANR